MPHHTEGRRSFRNTKSLAWAGDAAAAAYAVYVSAAQLRYGTAGHSPRDNDRDALLDYFMSTTKWSSGHARVGAR